MLHLLAGAQGGVSAAFLGMGAAACTILAALGVWIGRPIRKLVGELQQIVRDYREVPPRIEHREGREIVVDEGRPGIPGQIAELRNSVHELSVSVHEATRLVGMLGSIPEQLADNRQAIEKQFGDMGSVLADARGLAADAAVAASRAVQRTDERIGQLEDLVGAQLEVYRIRAERLTEVAEHLRASLHELGINVTPGEPS